MNAISQARLPGRLYRAAQVRAMDAYAAERLGIPGIELMHRAGAAAFSALRRRWPQARTAHPTLMAATAPRATEALVPEIVNR